MEGESKVKLGYWAIRGLAERIRHILEYLGIGYSEQKYEGEEGRSKWFNEDKPKLIEKNAAISLPYLKDGDRIISECDAIITHLVYKAGKEQLLGRNNDQKVRLALIRGIFKDLYPNYIRLVYGNYDQQFTFQQAAKDAQSIFDPYLEKLGKLLATQDYFCGNITVIDFTVAETVQAMGLISMEYFKCYPNLIEHQKRVWELPELKDYFSSDRYRERPCNNYTAAWK